MAASAIAVATIMVGAASAAAAGPDRVAEAPAAALASCSGESCRGKVAAEQGCAADAYQVAGVAVEDVPPGAPPAPHALLYYSPACDAAYGYYWSGNDGDQSNILVQTLYPYGGAPLPEDEIGYPSRGRNTFYTKMVPWGFSIRVCIRPLPNGNDKCTEWR
ncbi:hypothetical protein GCM10020358_53990 [Amorphoplanes nipponensis]|uniref:DUF2690 domain-containing protein n=2 Tax=Actinoplanes nipponensis TaxID=135950 RepID=A0A919MR47_9ACTN|nr:hypothetical protein Ani05nite_47320 [Actinoplanes nipponensis]